MLALSVALWTMTQQEKKKSASTDDKDRVTCGDFVPMVPKFTKE